MKEIIKDLIEKEISEHYDNWYRAKLELTQWVSASEEHKKGLREYMAYHEGKMNELKKELES